MSKNDEIVVGSMVYITFIEGGENIPEAWAEVVKIDEEQGIADIKFGKDAIHSFSMRHLKIVPNPEAILRDVNVLFRLQNPCEELKVTLKIGNDDEELWGNGNEVELPEDDPLEDR